MKVSFRPTPHFTVALTIIIALVAITTWLFWCIEQARADDMPVRAITAQMHAVCADMPRGNQEMENGRKQCFSKLYAQGRFKISRGLMGDDRDDEATSGEVQE